MDVAWNTRDARYLPLLNDALRGNDALVWKQALDGLVNFGSTGAMSILELALAVTTGEKAGWIREALEDMKAQHPQAK